MRHYLAGMLAVAVVAAPVVKGAAMAQDARAPEASGPGVPVC